MSDPVGDFSRHYERALGGNAYNDAFVSHFYKTFMGKSPEIAERFRETNMTAQKTALFDSLLYMAEFPHSQNARSRIIQLGHSHSHRAPPQHESTSTAHPLAFRPHPPATHDTSSTTSRSIAPSLR